MGVDIYGHHDSSMSFQSYRLGRVGAVSLACLLELLQYTWYLASSPRFHECNTFLCMDVFSFVRCENCYLRSMLIGSLCHANGMHCSFHVGLQTPSIEKSKFDFWACGWAVMLRGLWHRVCNAGCRICCLGIAALADQFDTLLLPVVCSVACLAAPCMFLA